MRKNVLMAISIVASLLAVSTFVRAEVTSDSEQIKEQTTLIANLKKAVVAATEYDNASIDVRSTATQVTVTVVDSKLLEATSGDRELDASKIASAIAEAMAGKTPFGTVVVIHVVYIKGQGSDGKTIDRVDYYKDPKGVFRHHVS